MNRRQFIGALVGLSAAPLLERVLPADDLRRGLMVHPDAVRDVLLPERTGVLWGLDFIGHGGPGAVKITSYAYESLGDWALTEQEALKRYAILQVFRKSGAKVLEFALDHRDNLHWNPGAEFGLLFTKQEPLILVAPAGMEVRARFSDLELEQPYEWRAAPGTKPKVLALG